MANPAADDEFLVGTSISGDGGVWIAYLAYSTLNTRQLPLITQALYFPAGPGSGIGATTNSGIDPTYWVPETNDAARCPNSQCFASGDYAGIVSNPYAAASTPFVKQNPPTTYNDMLQSFVQDPQGAPNVPNFTPKPIHFPLGGDIRGLAGPVPPQSAARGITLITEIGPPRRP